MEDPLQTPKPANPTNRHLWRGVLAGILGLSVFAFTHVRSEQHAEIPPPPPTRIQLVSAVPVADDPQAFQVVARISRADGGPIQGEFQITADLRDPGTGKPLLVRQCGYTVLDAADGRAAEILLTDRLPALPAKPVTAQVWVEHRWVPPSERSQRQLWQLALPIIPHASPHTQPDPALTCLVTLPPSIAAGKMPERKTRPARLPKAVRSLLWRGPEARRLALRE